MKSRIKLFFVNNLYFYKLLRTYQNRSTVFFNRPKDIIVCGMQRSGSTMLFNLVRNLVNLSNNEINTFFETDFGYNNILKIDHHSLIKKTHNFSPYIAKQIKRKKIIAFFTHRDIRDVMVSVIQKGWVKNIDEWIENGRLKAIANNAILWAKTKNMIVLSYTDLMQNREKCVQTIAETLNIKLTSEQISPIINSSNIEQVREQIKDMARNSKINTESQLHHNHIADAETGKWKNFFSPEEIRKINKLCADYLNFFNYPINEN